MPRPKFPPELERPDQISIEEATRRVLAGDFDLLTSDVFDTLVWRPVAAPHDLFVAVGTRLVSDGHLSDAVPPGVFALGRREAERQARERAVVEIKSVECTLEEIWDAMPATWWNPGSGPADGVAGELAVEAEALRLHPLANSLIADAHSQGVRIELVSDSYFSSAQLRMLLANAGVAHIDEIGVHTSSDARTNKWEGLLEAVVGEIATGPVDRWLHIGDNPVADLFTGARAGAEVCHFDIANEDDYVEIAERPWSRLSSVAATDGGRSGVVRETLLTAGQTGDGLPGIDPSYQFGVAAAGPIMAGFAGWASLTAELVGAGRLYCMLREGDRIAELIDVVRPQGPPRIRLHASRWAITRAAVIEGNADELERSISRRGPLTTEYLHEVFGLDPAAVAKVLGGHTIEHESRVAAYQALADDDSIRSQIVARSAELRADVATYLTQRLHIDDGPIVLCDIGWAGKIQESLTDIFATMGIDNRVIGLYALLSPPGELRVARGADMRSYLPVIGEDGRAADHSAIVVRNAEFLERVNTPAIGTLLGFEADGSPICRPDDHDRISDSLRLAQRGVFDFCSQLRDLVLVDPARQREWFEDSALAGAALEGFSRVIDQPDPQLAAALSGWEHDDVAGTDAEPLLNERFARWTPYLNGVDAAHVAMSDAFWVQGAANPVLAAETALVRGGTELDQVAAPSPTGPALLAVFRPGSELAVAQEERTPRVGRGGWMLMELNSAVEEVRSIRFDPAARPALIEIGDAHIELTTADPGTGRVVIDSAPALVAAATWVGGRSIGATKAVIASGGHSIVEIDPGSVTDVRSVKIRIAYRAWALDDSELAALLPRWRTITEQGTERAKRATRKLLSGLKP